MNPFRSFFLDKIIRDKGEKVVFMHGHRSHNWIPLIEIANSAGDDSKREPPREEEESVNEAVNGDRSHLASLPLSQTRISLLFPLDLSMQHPVS